MEETEETISKQQKLNNRGKIEWGKITESQEQVNSNKGPNNCVPGVLEEERKVRTGNVFKEVTPENFPRTEQNPCRINPTKSTL